MTEKEKIVSMLNEFNIEYHTYTDAEYIASEALEQGAVETICVRDNVDVAFDKDGKVVGSYTTSAGSYVSRK